MVFVETRAPHCKRQLAGLGDPCSFPLFLLQMNGGQDRAIPLTVFRLDRLDAGSPSPSCLMNTVQ